MSVDPASVADALVTTDVEMRNGRNYAIVPIGTAIDAARLLREHADTTNRLTEQSRNNFDRSADLMTRVQQITAERDDLAARLSALTDAPPELLTMAADRMQRRGEHFISGVLRRLAAAADTKEPT